MMQKGSVFLVVLVAAAIVGVGGLIILKNPRLITRPPTRSLIPTSVLTPTPSPNINLSGWKIFKETKFGNFEIKYPPDWYLESDSQTAFTRILSYQPAKFSYGLIPDGQAAITADVVYRNRDIPLDKWVGVGKSAGYTSAKEISRQTSTISNNQVVILSYIDKSGNNSYLGKIAYFPSGEYLKNGGEIVVQIQINFREGDTRESYYFQIFNQILSSFKFTNSEKVTYTGVVRTTGLLKEEKEKLGLQYSSYQLVANDSFKYNDIDFTGLYLEKSNDFDKYLGKCVTVTGVIPERYVDFANEKYQVNGQYNYQRIPFTEKSFETLSLDECDEYSLDTTSTQPPQDKEVYSLSGIIKRATRPAPDISYDYQVILDKPIIGVATGAGSNQTLKTIDVSYKTRFLEENVNKHVNFKATLEWGYAESQYLNIFSIE